MPNPEQISHRNHPGRIVQNWLTPIIPDAIHYLYRQGILHDTDAARILDHGETLHANDLTLTGLELSLAASTDLIENGNSTHTMKRLMTGGIMDAMDGPWARLHHETSEIGAAFDASVDRITDMHLASLISIQRSIYGWNENARVDNLQTIFCVSTLTKALSVMTDVKTREGGAGGMIERRRIQLATILLLSHLKHNPNTSILHQQLVIRSIDQNIHFLTEKSTKKANARIHAIQNSSMYRTFGWNNPDLEDPHSAASQEATKYAIIAALLTDHFHLDMPTVMTQFGNNITFPSPHALSQRYAHIRESMNRISPLLTRAMEIYDTYSVRTDKT